MPRKVPTPSASCNQDPADNFVHLLTRLLAGHVDPSLTSARINLDDARDLNAQNHRALLETARAELDRASATLDALLVGRLAKIAALRAEIDEVTDLIDVEETTTAPKSHRRPVAHSVARRAA